MDKIKYILSLLIMSCETADAPPKPVTFINLGIKPYNMTLWFLKVMRFAKSAQIV